MSNCSWIPIAVSFAFAWTMFSSWLTVTSTEPLELTVTANAGVAVRALRRSRMAVRAPATPSVPPASTRGRRRKRPRPGSGRPAWVRVAPCSRTRSSQRLSVKSVIVFLFPPQPGPRPGQALPECDPGDAEGLRRLHRAEPGQVDELDGRPFDRGQLRAPLHERGSVAFGVDPLGEVLDLVPVQWPVAAETRDGVPAAGPLLAVVGEHVGGDAEQPGPVRAPAGVEPGESTHGPDECLGGEVGDRLGLRASAPEVAHEDVDVAPVHLLEVVARRVRRPPRRPPFPHRDRSPPCHQCSGLYGHVPGYGSGPLL